MENQNIAPAEWTVDGSAARSRDRGAGWTVLAILAVVFILSSFLNPVFCFHRMFFAYSVSGTLIFNWICVAAISLALIDIHPVKRVLLFLLLACTFFGILYCVGIETGRRMVSSGPPLRQLGLFVFIAPLLCVSTGWAVWLLRVFRGWRITTELESGNRSQANRTWELVCMGFAVVLAVALAWAGGNQSVTPFAFAAGGFLTIVLIAPITFWLMRTRRPVLVWSILGIGIPTLILIGTILFQFQHYWLSGILMTEEAKMVTGLVFAGLFPLLTFLVALRLLGFQLIYSKPWTRSPKIVTQATKPHPLDD